MVEEKLLIKSAARGNERAFEEIVDLYKNYVFAIILNFIKDKEEVENIAQEVFLQIYLSLPQYKEDNFKAWISRITANKSIDSLRAKRSKFREEVPRDEEIFEKSYLQDHRDPLSLLLEKEKHNQVTEAVEALPEIYREVLRKFYYEEKSYKDIAREESISEKTVESRLYRGRKLLREKWREGR